MAKRMCNGLVRLYKYLEEVKMNADDKNAKVIIREGFSAIDELISNTKNEDKLHLE
jgi:predicted metal-dependent phosphoesterase TrpH